MRYFLCGQTGNRNRGCEAIIRSTVKVLNQRNGDIYLASFAPDQDQSMVRELGINMIPYGKYPSAIHRYISGALRKIISHSVIGTRYVAEDLYAHMKPDDISFNIGGDTYCYGRPLYSIALNRYTSKNKIKNILWCCSIEQDVIKGEILQDLNRYQYIFPREQITYNHLISSGISKEKIIKVCDPAFFLDKKEVPLPHGFVEGNTVGLNVSECVIDENDQYVYQNVIHMAKYILEKTDMSLCLIPHVYSIEKNLCDWPILKRIQAELQSDRVSIVDQEYDCERLKYIISKCRFMVCARTHASIAAYSSFVPTLVLGYSIKSTGIATDLFGTDKNYVVSYKDLTEKEELTKAFQYIVAHELEIKNKLHKILPDYKRQLTEAIEVCLKSETKERETICDPNLCNGCGTCAASCPLQCIQMVKNEEGFLYPYVDSKKCIHCENCYHICPVANRYCDDNNKPDTFAAIIIDNDVRKNSSSGGIFSIFAEEIINQGGVIFGAAYDYRDACRVKHVCVAAEDEIERLRGSKYVQSDLGDTYKQVQRYLQKGQKVLFSGTPCQVGGLHAYLGREYDNLYLVDFICHGVPSPKIWDKYVKFREKEASSKTRSIFCRDKKYGWKRYSVRFEFENDAEYRQILTDDMYMRGYLAAFCLRPSCYECAYRNVHHRSDITLADYWGIEKQNPEQNDDKGSSLVMIHSEKGATFFRQCKNRMKIWQIAFDEAIADNGSMLRSMPMPRLRKNYMQDIDHLEMDRLTEKYCGHGIFAKMRRGLAKL